MRLTRDHISGFLFFMIAAAVLFSSCPTLSIGEPLQREAVLFDTYQKIAAKLEKTVFGLPLYVESSDQDGMMHADVYGIIAHPFSRVSSVLIAPENWCDIAFLHPNVQACTYSGLPGARRLTFFVGRKYYQPLENTYRLNYIYRKVEQRPGYLDIVLAADEGPFGTKVHKLRFEALPLDKERTFVHFKYSYLSGALLRFGENIYFSTLGRGKVGFTVKGTDSDGNPVYIGGRRGLIERNAVRYYVAIQSFMDTLSSPENDRFIKRISEWYDLTGRYHKQLSEMDKKDYLEFKTEEYKNQVSLQREIDAANQ